jgi:hypothetical protein
MATKPAKTVNPVPATPRGPNPKEVTEKVSKRNGHTKVADKTPKK